MPQWCSTADMLLFLISARSFESRPGPSQETVFDRSPQLAAAIISLLSGAGEGSCLSYLRGRWGFDRLEGGSQESFMQERCRLPILKEQLKSRMGGSGNAYYLVSVFKIVRSRVCAPFNLFDVLRVAITVSEPERAKQF